VPPTTTTGPWSAIQAVTDIVQHHRDGNPDADAEYDGKTCGDGKQADCFTDDGVPFITRDPEPLFPVGKPRPLQRASVFHLGLLPQWLQAPRRAMAQQDKGSLSAFRRAGCGLSHNGKPRPVDVVPASSGRVIVAG
jgi:hypothetical protein